MTLEQPLTLQQIAPLVFDRTLVDVKLPAIVKAGDPVLRDGAAYVLAQDISTDKMRRLVHTMVEVMRRAPGVGLAAPQIGIPLRVIVVEDRKQDNTEDPRERQDVPLMAIFNPEIVRVKGSRKVSHYEGCLSVPGYSAIVARDSEVEVTGLDMDGKRLRVKVQGWAARIFQHECDHLKGTLYVDKMNPRSFVFDA